MSLTKGFSAFVCALFYALFVVLAFVISPYVGVAFLIPPLVVVIAGLKRRHDVKHPKHWS
jgi:hypothetical protein